MRNPRKRERRRVGSGVVFLARLAVAVLAATPLPASAAGRVALVFGNSTYAAIGALPNPGNDAADVGAALRRLGFDVTVVLDADLAGMNAGLRTFARRSDGADVALVFYAGHGMEVDRVNYLLPVDAQPERDTDVEYVAIPLDRVLRATEGAGLRVVVLDACRNNPWARSMRRTRGVRNVSRGSFGELDEQQFEDETLVAYAAAAGTTADDGEGRNSPYTRALLAHLEEPLEIGMLFRRVRQQVLASTGGRQRPHEYQSLLRAHYLSAAAPLPEEEVFWESVRGTADPLGLETYLERWPAGRYTALARSRLAGLRDARLWTAVENSRNPGDFAAYLEQFPTGRYALLARNRLTNLRDERFWAGIADSGNPADFEAYVVRFPEGRYAPAARNRLAALRRPAAVASASPRVAPAPVAESSRPAGVPVPPRVEFETAPAPADPPTAPVVASNADPPSVFASAAEPDPSAADRDPAGGLRPGARFRDCRGCPELVVVPAGTFRMGSTRGQADERPVHAVRLEAFALGRYEVTREEYAAFVDATGHGDAGCGLVDGAGRLDWDDGASWRRPGFAQDDRHPAVCVSWADALAYVRWLTAETGESYRLPSEAEWEYGARANTRTERYWDGASGSQCEHANSGDRALLQRGWPLPVVNCADGAAHTAPVGSYGANAFGLHDVLGNVWEWTADCWHDGYRGAPDDASAWTRRGDCDRRVLRGGSWETVPSGLRSANRYRNDDNRGSVIAGFRVARAVR